MSLLFFFMLLFSCEMLPMRFTIKTIKCDHFTVCPIRQSSKYKSIYSKKFTTPTNFVCTTNWIWNDSFLDQLPFTVNPLYGMHLYHFNSNTIWQNIFFPFFMRSVVKMCRKFLYRGQFHSFSMCICNDIKSISICISINIYIKIANRYDTQPWTLVEWFYVRLMWFFVQRWMIETFIEFEAFRYTNNAIFMNPSA